MTLRLGFFADFKGSDLVLLAGASSDVENLSLALVKFAESNGRQFAIHNLASIAPRHQTQLFVHHTAQETRHLVPAQFSWLCTSSSMPDIQTKLLELVHSSNGHQYFDLEGSDTQLIVSIGEYNDDWWQEHG